MEDENIFSIQNYRDVGGGIVTTSIENGLLYNASADVDTKQTHVLFDPIKNFNGLNDEKMSNNLRQDHYRNISPWRALIEVIAIPVVMLAFIIVVKINILVKIILVLMIVIHIIISTCLVSYLSKNYQMNGDEISSSAASLDKTNNLGAKK